MKTLSVNTKDNSEVYILPNKVLGFSAQVKGNGIFYDKDNIFYVCENSIVLYNLKNKTGEVQINIPLIDQSIQAFTIKRSLIALGISGPESLIYVYSIKNENRTVSYRKERELCFFKVTSGIGYVASLDISAKNNFIAALIAHPYRLCVFSNEKEVIILNLRFTHFHRRHTKQLHQVCFHPTNEKVLLLVGDGVFRIIRIKIIVKGDDWESRFKTIGFYQAKNLSLRTACWMNHDRVLAGTIDGRLLIVENGVLKGIYWINNLNRIFIPTVPPLIGVKDHINWTKVAQQKSSDEEKRECSIHGISVFENGFVIANRYVQIFEERCDQPRWFIRTSVLSLMDDEIPKYLCNMDCLSTRKLLTLSSSEIKYVLLIDLNKPGEERQIEKLENMSAGRGRVTAISCCLWRPLCLSLSGSSLAFWNYNTAEVINIWNFHSIPAGVSLHPSGSRFCLLFNNYLCMFDIHHNHSYMSTYRSCKLSLQVYYTEHFTHCTFSEGGTYFGGSTVSRIYIFHNTSYQIINVFEPGTVLIHSIIDDLNDTITSISPDGLIMCYDLLFGKLSWKCQEGREVKFEEFVEDRAHSTIHIIGFGNYITLNLTNQNKSQYTGLLHHSVPLDGPVSAIAVSQASRAIFFGGGKGTIGLFGIPAQGEAEEGDLDVKEYRTQSSGVSKMIITPTNKLITGNDGGYLSVYNIGGRAFTDYECPHDYTDFLMGSFSLLKLFTSVRKTNEKTIKDWHSIQEYMLKDRAMKWTEECCTNITTEIKRVEERLEDIEHVRNYYDHVWEEMDSFWPPQREKEINISSNYLYYNEQFRSRDNNNYEAWTRGLWHLQRIETASKALSSVMEGTLESVLAKKTIQEGYLEGYKSCNDYYTKKIAEIRKKIGKSCNVYRKLYITSRNSFNALQNFIMQEAAGDKPEFNKDINRKTYELFIIPFQQDLKILDGIYKRFQYIFNLQIIKIIELSYFDKGPTGITLKLLPNITMSPFEIDTVKRKKKEDLCRYLNSQPAQWRELKRWYWIMKEYTNDYYKWFSLAQSNFGNAFYNSHAFHELGDVEKIKHLSKKQVSLIHNCSAHCASLNRSVKAVNQFYFECIKVKNDCKAKLSRIGDRIEESTVNELFTSLMDMYTSISYPHKIREDVNNLKKSKPKPRTAKKRVKINIPKDYGAPCPFPKTLAGKKKMLFPPKETQGCYN